MADCSQEDVKVAQERSLIWSLYQYCHRGFSYELTVEHSMFLWHFFVCTVCLLGDLKREEGTLYHTVVI